jgi:hypothetical protein
VLMGLGHSIRFGRSHRTHGAGRAIRVGLSNECHKLKDHSLDHPVS